MSQTLFATYINRNINNNNNLYQKICNYKIISLFAHNSKTKFPCLMTICIITYFINILHRLIIEIKIIGR